MPDMKARFATIIVTVPIRLLNISMPVIPKFADDNAKPLM
jgi:hypothetical protein